MQLIYVHCLCSLCVAPTFSLEGIKNFLTIFTTESGFIDNVTVRNQPFLHQQRVSNGLETVSSRVAKCMTQQFQFNQKSILTCRNLTCTTLDLDLDSSCYRAAVPMATTVSSVTHGIVDDFQSRGGSTLAVTQPQTISRATGKTADVAHPGRILPGTLSSPLPS